MARIWLAMVLLVCAGVCQAQGTGTFGEPLPPNLGTDPDVRSKRADHNLQDGGWWVRPKKKKKEVIVGEPEPAASK